MFRKTHLRTNRSLVTLVAAAFLTVQNIQAASNLPTGGNFVAGSGNIATSGNILTINQNSLKGIIDWSTFSIAHGATVNFKNGAGATLNRVTGATPSTVLGQLLATGNIYLINPEGILIGHGATIHTGGDFLATTLNLPNSFFLNNHFQFTGNSPATVVNLGDIASTGGNIYLIGRSVQNGGSISSANGTAGLAAGSQVLITDSLSNQKVAVQAPGGDVTNSGFIHAAQVELKSNGGNIYALAGNNGGLINATGTATQDGHVWLIATNGTTNVSGLISATNTNGVGGAIETSGAHVNTNGAQITTGKGGSWLLDPDDLTIDSSLAGTIETSLNGGTNVTEQTGNGNTGNGDITVASSIAWTSGADLTLSAYRNIGVNNGVTISNTGAGNLSLRADNTSTGTGAVTISGLVDFSGSTGNVAILYDPPGIESAKYGSPVVYDTGTSGTQVKTNSAWTAPTDYSVSSQATAYMLVNNVTDLQNVFTNLSGNYAAGTDIDASSVANFTPIATSSSFTGIFDGQGHTISNLTINDTTDDYVGLFGNSTGKLRNVSLTNESVTGSHNYTGGLVGINNTSGVVANVASAGTVSVNATSTPPYIGGIAGWNYATLTNSSSSAAVSVSNNDVPIYAGGLVGVNFGPVSQSFATGSVIITAPVSPTDYYPHAGGLVGYNNNSITSSYATGSVQVSSGSSEDIQSSAGGLVGQAQGGNITNTYATGTVSAGTNIYAGGLIGYDRANVTSSYAAGSVSAATTGFAGGLFGYYTTGTITSSYWDNQATAQSGASGNSATISGASGETTATLQNGSLPTGFSSSNWVPASGFYPFLIWQERVISGDVFNGLSPLSSVTVDALANGVNIGSATTNGSGFYSFFVPAADLAGASGVLTYLPGPTKGNTFSDGDGSGEFTGMNIYGGTLTLNNRTNSTYSGMLTALNSALGGNSGADFLFSPNSGNISLNAGANLSINSQVAFNLDQTISTPSGTVTIASQGDVAESQPITSSALSLSGAGNFSLGQGNSVGTLAASTEGSVTFINSGDITIGTAAGITGVTAGGAVFVSSTGGNLTIASGSTVSAIGSGDALQLSAGNAFVNLEGSDALNIPDGGGRWLVFSQNPANDTRGGLAYDFKQYNYNAAVDTPDQETGNGFIYAYAPSLTIGLTGTTSKTYDGLTSATLTSGNYSIAGGIDGDGTTLSGTPSSGNFADANAGSAKTVTASGLSLSNVTISNGAATIYGYQLSSTSASGSIGAISPAFLTYTANGTSRTYGAANPTFSGSVTGFVNDETLATATTGSAVFTSPATATSNVGSYAINGSGLTANNGNYTFLQAESNPSALTISPAFLTYTANGTSRTYGAANPTFSGSVSGFVNDETLATATTGTLAFASPATTTSNVGSYAINGSGLAANNGNYTFLQAESNPSALTINPAVLTYTANSASRTYGSNNPSFTGSVTGLVNEQTLAAVTTGSAIFTSPATTASNVGGYAINGSGLTLTTSNYTLAQAEGNASALTISPAFLTYTANGTSRTYGAANPTFSGSVTGFVNDQNLATATTGTLAFASPATTTSNVGSYAINGSGLTANNGNYTFLQAESNPSALTISPAFLTYTANGTSRTYGAANPTFSGSVTGFVNDETLATATTGTLAFASPATTTSNVGSYAINGSGLTAINGNYTFLQAESNPSALTISPAFLTYTANGTSRTYGAANPTFSGSVSGFMNGETMATATTGTLAFASPATTTSNVGSYAINGSGLAANNGNYTFLQAESNPSALTISPAFLTYTANGTSRIYGAANPTFSGSVSGFVNDETLATATTGTLAFASPATTTSNVGSYAINGSGLTANNGNYTFLQAESNPSALTISPAFLTYTASGTSRTYGAANPTFSGSVTGFVNDETLATATTGTLAFASPATTTSNVGSYAINGSGLAANNGNYTFLQAESNPSALTISPAFLTYTANGTSRTYGAANPTFSGSVTGFVNDQTLATATTGTLAFASPATTTSNVGSYAINGSGLAANNGNYTFLQAESNPSALTISPAFLTYTANGTSRTYGAANPTFSGSVSGFMNGETMATATTGTLAFASPATTTSNVGSYAINGSGLAANNGNYTFLQAESNPSALTISPAFLTYTANGTSRIYGAANPTFSGSVSGFVNDETLATATTGTLAFASPATTTSNVGSYAINGSGLTANNGNYTFLQAESNPSALTISPAFLTYTANGTSRTYGAANPTFSGSVTGFVNDQTLATATTGTLAFASPATTTSNVGSYAINGSGLTVNSGNYVFTQAEGNASALTISPATLTYTANAGSRTYGSANPSFTGSVTGFVGDQTLVSATTGSATFTSPATAASNVAAYAINGSGLTANNGNYVFAQADGNASALTINPATLTYSANPASQASGSANTSFTGSVSGFVNGETLVSATAGSAAFTSTTSASSPAGTYVIDGSGLTANHGNYIFTQAPGNATALTLTAASVPPPTPTTITIDVNNVTSLNGQTPTFTAAYVGSPIDGLNINSVLAGLNYQIMPAVSGPGTYTITATGNAPIGYSFNFVPGTLTVLDNSPVTLPTQTTLFVPETPVLLPVVVSGAQPLSSPVNSLGIFQIVTVANPSGATNVFGISFAGFDSQETPLAQSSYFATASDKPATFVAGAKP